MASGGRLGGAAPSGAAPAHLAHNLRSRTVELHQATTSILRNPSGLTPQQAASLLRPNQRGVQGATDAHTHQSRVQKVTNQNFE